MACFPAESWPCFAAAVPTSGYPADQVPHGRGHARVPPSPWEQGLAWGRRAPTAWQPLGTASHCVVQAPAFPHFRFFSLKSPERHCAINEPRLGVSVQCPWQLQCDIAASLPGVAAATSAGLALRERRPLTDSISLMGN